MGKSARPPVSRRAGRIAAFLAAGVACVVVWLSLTGAPEDVIGTKLSDKLGHFLAYAALTLPLAHACGSRLRAGRAAITAFVIAVSLGASLELLQDLTPQRQPSVLDAVANAIGAGLSASFWLVMARWIVRRLGPAAAGIALIVLAGGAPGCAAPPRPGDPMDALERDPLDVEARLAEAGALQRHSDLKAALEFYQRAQAQYRGATEQALFGYLGARLIADRHDREAALSGLDLTALGWRAYAAAIDEGDLRLMAGDQRQALARYQRAEHLAGDRAPPRLTLRLNLLQNTPDPVELGRLLAAREVRPFALPDAFVTIAWLHIGNPKRALQNAEKQRAAGLEDALGARAFGLALSATGRAEDRLPALRAFERAIRLGGAGVVDPARYEPPVRDRVLALVAPRDPRFADRAAVSASRAAELEELGGFASKAYPGRALFWHAYALGAHERGDDDAALARA
ncbi:MAG: VanZ family protein, partial [Planctomycetota bacterium]